MDAYKQLEGSKPMSMKVEGPTSTAGAGNRRAGAPTAKQAHRKYVLYESSQQGCHILTSTPAPVPAQSLHTLSSRFQARNCYASPERDSSRGTCVRRPLDLDNLEGTGIHEYPRPVGDSMPHRCRSHQASCPWTSLDRKLGPHRCNYLG